MELDPRRRAPSSEQRMRIVLTGTTGFVGGEVLEQLLAHREVDSVTSLARKAVARKHPKLRAITIADFEAYDDALAVDLASHDACLWTLGGKASDFASEEGYAKVTHDYTLALANVFAKSGRGISFCYLSGMGADPTESARLPWERKTRHLKGRTEKDLAALSAAHPSFTAYAFRPGGILPRASNVLKGLFLSPIALRVDELAAAMIRIALEGSPLRLLDNGMIRAAGNDALANGKATET